MTLPTVCIKLRLRKSTKNAQFSFCCFVYDPSGFRYCAKPDLRYQRSLPVAAEEASRSKSLLLMQVLYWPSSPPRTCSCTRGRLVKNNPVRVTKVAVGMEELIRDEWRVNDFFHFSKKNLSPAKTFFTTPTSRLFFLRHMVPVEALSISLGWCM